MRLPLTLVLLFCQPLAFADPLDDFAALVRQGRYESKTCGRFKKKWRGIVKGGLTMSSDAHTSKEHALETLKLIEKSPGWARSYLQARRMLLEKGTELAQAPNQAEWASLAAEIELPCEGNSRVVHASILFRDIAKYSLTKKDQARVHRLARKELKADLPFARMSEASLRASLLQSYLEHAYVGEGKSTLLTRAKEWNAAVEAARGELASREAKLPADRQRSLDPFVADAKAAAEVSAGFEAILKDITFP